MSKNEKRYRLTEGTIMQLVLNDFGIDVSFETAQEIYKEFMKLMHKQGYIKKVKEKDKK